MKKTLILLILGITLLIQATSFAEGSARTFAVELEYGAANTTFLPLNESGRSMYGVSLRTNPVGASLIWSAAPGINIGLSYSSSTWASDKNYLVGGDPYSNPKLNITSISPFIDLTPFALSEGETSGITKGFFIEIGPAYTTILEEYEKGSRYTFSASGLSLDIRAGFRAMNHEPLSFVARAKFSIPIASDSKRSDSGLTMNGVSSISIHAGACLSF